MKKYIVKGKNKEELLQKTAKYFNVSLEDISYEVIREEKSLLGNTKEIELRVWLKSEEIKEREILQKEEEKIFEIKILKSGIYLMVNKNIEMNDFIENSIIEEIVKRDIKIPIFSEIYKACREKKGEFVKIADYDPDYYIDSEIIVTVLNNKLEAAIEVTPPQRGNPPDYDKIITKLKASGIIFGIKETSIRQFLSNIVYNEPFIVAEGKKPVNGNDAEIKFLFNTEKTVIIKENENGKVDYTDVAIINNVLKGQEVAQKIPATNGEPGMNVFGEIIEPLPGKDKKFPKGKNVQESEDGEFLLASIDGYVSLVNGMVNVTPLYTVNGDVNFSTGNIEFVGSVYVRGNVTEGFYIKSEGDVIIDGIVENAIIEAKGNVFIKGGIHGKEGAKGYVKAGGNIEVKFVENIELRAEGDIISREYIIHSNVYAGGKISVINGKGKVLGGEIIAGKEISVLNLGSEYGANTLVEVGISPEYRERLKIIEKDLEFNLTEKEKIERELATLRKQKEEGKLSEQKQALFLEYTKQQFIILKNINSLKQEKEKINDILKNSKNGKIHVIDKLYPNVILRIFDQQIITKEVFKFATFYLNENINEISILPCEISKK